MARLAEVIWAQRILSRAQLQHVQDLADIAARRTVLNAHFDQQFTFDLLCSFGCQHWSRRFEWPWALEVAPITSRDVVLEAGGGDTEFQFLLARRAKRVVNFDHDQGVLDASEVFARELGLHNLLQRRGDLTSVYYPDASFDKVFCTSVIEHIEEAEQCVAELWRVLKPSGRLVLTMDILEHGKSAAGPGGTYLFGLERTQRLLSRWNLALPSLPADVLRQPIGVTDPAGASGEVNLLVLCVAVDK